jgi:hypothetical protein
MKSSACIKTLCCVGFIALMASCSQHNSIKSIILPSTPVISTDERFALVIDPYISMRDQPGENGITVSHGRRGEIFEVTGKKILKDGHDTVLWVNLGTGWVVSASVEFYSSKDKAKTASARFK